MDLLLKRLHSDPEHASREYQALRRKLVDFFDWRGGTAPEEMADDALDRVAHKLAQGEPVEHLRAYVHGVARHVLQEGYKQTLRERKALQTIALEPAAVVASTEAHDERLPCLRKCLQELPAESRTLIIAYYDGDGRAHLAERKALAEELSIPYATLKTRAHRVRLALEACLQACLKGPRP